jgi:hypothetical protein
MLSGKMGWRLENFALHMFVVHSDKAVQSFVDFRCQYFPHDLCIQGDYRDLNCFDNTVNNCLGIRHCLFR